MIVMPTSEEGGAGEENERIVTKSEPGGKSDDAERCPEEDWRFEEFVNQDSGDCGDEYRRQRLVRELPRHTAIVEGKRVAVNGGGGNYVEFCAGDRERGGKTLRRKNQMSAYPNVNIGTDYAGTVL